MSSNFQIKAPAPITHKIFTITQRYKKLTRTDFRLAVLIKQSVEIGDARYPYLVFITKSQVFLVVAYYIRIVILSMCLKQRHIKHRSDKNCTFDDTNLIKCKGVYIFSQIKELSFKYSFTE